MTVESENRDRTTQIGVFTTKGAEEMRSYAYRQIKKR